MTATPSPADRWVERVAGAAFVLSILAGLALGVLYWFGGEPQLEGLLLGVSLAGIGAGMVVWAKRFLPHDEVEEERGPMGSTEEERRAFTSVFRHGERAITRRRTLALLLAGALASLGAALLFPIRSLGPRPGRGLYTTAYRGGARVVTGDGRPVRPRDLPVEGVVTVWPENHVGDGDASTLLIRVEDPSLFAEDTREDWTVEGVVAYSKLCTHVGCPVGLYQAREHLLLCPCHQSTFDVLRGAEPVFGPATRSLPQLPLGVDPEGFLVATGDFEFPPGPGFWDIGRKT